MQNSSRTYFITSNTYEKKALLQSERVAGLFVHTMYFYRQQGRFELHEFVVMPNHFHVLLTPSDSSLERVVQFIKGDFLFVQNESLESEARYGRQAFMIVG